MCPKDSDMDAPAAVVEENLTEKEDESKQASSNLRPPVNPIWSRATDYFIHYLVPESVTFVALIATRRPRTTICSIGLLSFALAAIGYFTNFNLDVSQFNAFAPYGVRTRAHKDWIQEESGYPPENRLFVQMVHANGANVVTVEGIRKAFEAYQVIDGMEKYKEYCAFSNQEFYDKESDECQISSPLRYWNYNQTLFEETVQSDQDVMDVLLRDNYPDGTPAETRAILGNFQIDNQNDGNATITAESLMTVFFLPELQSVTSEFEEAGLNELLPTRDKWLSQDEHPFRLEVINPVAYELEFTRALNEDFKLVPVVFFLMAGFTCSTFYRKDPVESRLMLGIGAVITIVCSLMAGYGFLFICGVPLNNLSTLVPFVVFGVGLDDTFIITGAFARTSRHQSMEERIRKTMKDIGVSITVTTLSTFMALALGALSKVPAVSWLCKYAMTTILVDFIWQISFFVALLVLDEERIQANRRGCCICLKAPDTESTEANEAELQQQPAENQFSKPSFVDRLMFWYADHILHPVVKLVVLISFAGLFAGCAYSASMLTQEFKITELLPADSYVIDFLDASDSYTPRYLPVMAYFRFVDQSDSEIQKQMITYVDEIGNLTYFAEPQFCWVKDVQALLNDDSLTNSPLGLALQNLTFNEQLQLLLTDPTVKELYGTNIVLDEDGNIESSRCQLLIEDLDWNVIEDQVGLLHAQAEVSASQPINQGREQWAFFNYNDAYLTFEFYDAVEQEFIFTALVGILAVTLISFFCIPHWTAIFFVLPTMGLLYVDLIGVIQAAGLHINIVTHVTLAMAVGLLVDYLVHVLLRFYETTEIATREEKVKDTLRTMGAAVLSGGLSTLLGVLPLIFASSEVTRTVFVSFLAMVTLGVGHGLIFLPVVLSIVGPEGTPILGQRNELPITEEKENTEEKKRVIEPEEIDQDAPLEVDV